MDRQIPDITDREIGKFEKKRKETLLPHEGTWVHDIPFFLVPVDIVMGFTGNNFTPEEFYLSTEWTAPNHWNAGFVKDGGIVIFMYGHTSKLEKYIYAARIGASRSVQSTSRWVWDMAIGEIEKIAREKGFRYIWTTTHRRGEIRKLTLKAKEDGAIINPKFFGVLWRELK